ncbi:MAG: polysaccharide deacetylase family protein [Muribaculaceae bacterium]|nr:polysaccharide deacetylase family protein [Muribaculaceae bacterium]MDE6866075.1 polysaccharide deacetylase family protein [Muribaculaceae bacterium]
MSFKKIYLIIYFLAYHTGIIWWFYRLNRSRQRILVFHHILPDHLITDSFEQQFVCSSQSHFERIIDIVNKRLDVTTQIGKPNSAIITIDDGYRSSLIADEVLSKYGNNAYFFLPLFNVDAGPLWNDRIKGWMAYVTPGEYIIAGQTYYLYSQSSRRKAYNAIIDSIYTNDCNYSPIIEELETICPFDKLNISEDYANLRFRGLTLDEISQLKRNGHKIGAHSINHEVLSLLPSEKLKQDFQYCGAQINKLFNCSLYAYPFGHKRHVSIECVKECASSGFSAAVMNEYVPDETPYTISRMNIIRYTSRYEIDAELSGFKQWLRNILRWKK